jgi:hypothetical protein
VSWHLGKDKNDLILHEARNAHLGFSKHPVHLVFRQRNSANVTAEFQHDVNIYNKIKWFQTTLANQLQVSVDPDLNARLSSRIQAAPEKIIQSRSFAGHFRESRKFAQTDGSTQFPAIAGKLKAIDRAR